MNITNLQPRKLFKSSFALALIALLIISLFSACGSADASKKEKSKKSKAKVEEVEEEETESTEKKESKESNSKEPAEKDADRKKAATEPKVSPEVIWEDLIKGNKRFMAGKHTNVNYTTSRVSLSKGQKPQVIILGCADSRVPPEFLFDKNLGELFVVRDAGNIADEVSLGSIEYAIEHLHAKMIVVLGHESCGAVAAAVSGEKMPSRNLSAITDSIAPSFDDSKTCTIGKEPNISCVELNARHSAKDLLLKSAIIKKAVEEETVSIVSAVYHFDSGEVVRLK